MRITALEVDGFGVWTGLKLEGLSEGLNVFYGPNEAGKTTLMQFVRSVLYGFSADRRRYLPPAQGGKPGGTLELAVPSGRFQVTRHAGDGGAEPQGELAILAADGTRQGEHLLKTFLSNVDEPIFNNVFAVGLEELQELRTLNDTEAAALLYNLSAGLDRVSLVEVMQELRASRNRLLDAAGGPCQVLQLLSEREKLLAEIEDLQTLTGRYARLAGERRQADREAARLGEETAELAYQCRVIEIAISLRERWQKRQTIDRQIASMGAAERVPEGAVERLDALNTALEERRVPCRRVQAPTRPPSRRGAGAPGKREPFLSRPADRGPGRAGGLDWQIGNANPRTGNGDFRCPDEAGGPVRAIRPGPGWISGNFRPLACRAAPPCGGHAAHGQAAGRGEAGRPRRAGNGALAWREGPVGLVRAQRARSCGGHGPNRQPRGAIAPPRADRPAPGAARPPAERIGGQEPGFDRSGNAVARGACWFGQRACDRFDPRALAHPGRGLLDAFLGCDGLAAYDPGLRGCRGSDAGQVPARTIEPAAAGRPSEAARNAPASDQAGRRGARGTRQTVAPRRRPDCFAAGGGRAGTGGTRRDRPLGCQASGHPGGDRGRHRPAQQAETELAEDQRRWREAVSAAGLPKGLVPKQVREMAACADSVRETRERLARRREELDQRTRELEGVTGRIAQLVRDAGVDIGQETPVEQLRTLTQQVSQQESRIHRRQEIRRELREIRRKQAKLEAATSRLKRDRRALLEGAGVKDEQELRQRAAQQARTASLCQERENLQREIEAAIAGHCPEETVGQQMEGDPVALESRRSQLEKRRQACEIQAQQRFEKRGQFNEQMKVLAENRTPGVKQLELAMLETRWTKFSSDGGCWP